MVEPHLGNKDLGAKIDSSCMRYRKPFPLVHKELLEMASCVLALCEQDLQHRFLKLGSFGAADGQDRGQGDREENMRSKVPGSSGVTCLCAEALPVLTALRVETTS